MGNIVPKIILDNQDSTEHDLENKYKSTFFQRYKIDILSYFCLVPSVGP